MSARAAALAEQFTRAVIVRLGWDDNPDEPTRAKRSALIWAAEAFVRGGTVDATADAVAAEIRAFLLAHCPTRGAPDAAPSQGGSAP